MMDQMEIASIPEGKQLQNLMRCCSSCENIPSPNSPICDNGHVTCFECAKERDKCKFQFGTGEICNHALQPHQPCYLYLTVFNSSTIVCPSVGDVCTTVVRADNLSNHFKICAGTKNLECKFTLCGLMQLYTVPSLIDHLKVYHDVPIYKTKSAMLIHRVRKREQRFDEIGIRKVSFVLESNPAVFICSLVKEIIEENEFLAVHLQHANSEVEANGQTFNGYITLIGGNDPIRSRKCIIPSIWKQEAEITEELYCLLIPMSQLQSEAIWLIQIKVDYEVTCNSKSMTHHNTKSLYPQSESDHGRSTE